MFWIISFIIIMIISGALAVRSMRNFGGVTPVSIVPYGLFLIRNKHAFNLEALSKLYAFSKVRTTFSLERLFKGNESAFIIFAPTNIVDIFPELNLLQLENYLPSVRDTFIWQIAPKQNKKKLVVAEDFLKSIKLKDDEQFFWQIVCSVQKEIGFYVTIRVMIFASEQTKRIEIAKNINKHILDSTGLIKQAREESNHTLFASFEKRVLTGTDISEFMLSPGEVLALLGA